MCVITMIALILVPAHCTHHHWESVSQDKKLEYQLWCDTSPLWGDEHNKQITSGYDLIRLGCQRQLACKEKRQMIIKKILFYVLDLICLQNCSTSFNLQKIKRYNTHKYYPKPSLFPIDYWEKIQYHKIKRKFTLDQYFMYFQHTFFIISPTTNLNSEILILCQILRNTSGIGNLIKTNSIKLIIKIAD